MFVNTPPMGWNTWNTFGADINEELIKETADAMVSSGLSDAGYKYVVIDDMWAEPERDRSGHLVPDRKKFPHGMKYIGDYIHSLGLKFGIYSCAGYVTCGGFPGSYDHEWTDAKTFAEWGVDFLKYDFCYRSTVIRPDVLIKRMSAALSCSGRDILLSACTWGTANTKQWIKETGAQMWRSTVDIADSWESVKALSQSQIVAQEYNGKGCFNDMDMLVVGMKGKGNVALTGCTFEEYKLHFSLWALLGSPLMIGCDVRNMDDETKEILFNRDLIAIDQDQRYCEPFFANRKYYEPNPARKPSEPYYKDYPVDCPVIARFLDNGDIAIGFFNFNDWEIGPAQAAFIPEDIGIPLSSGKTLEFRDLWSGEKIETKNGLYFISSVAPHSCRMFRAKIV